MFMECLKVIAVCGGGLAAFVAIDAGLSIWERYRMQRANQNRKW